MRGMPFGTAAGLLALLALGGCRDADEAERADEGGLQAQAPPAAEVPPAPPPPMTAADSARLAAGLAARADSLRAAFAALSPLSPREVAELRQDVNAEQVASARALGMRVSGQSEIDRLVGEGELVALGDSTEWWVLREMDHSAPYVRPATRAMLQELGRRFHARLDAAGVPRYRVKVTSALRTADDQEDLRKINSYATSSRSAHEFATTVDVSHERFAVPAVREGAAARPEEREMEGDTLQAVADEHSRALQAALGRAIAEMRDEGRLHVMMENRQPVYHMTLARPDSAAGGPCGGAPPQGSIAARPGGTVLCP